MRTLCPNLVRDDVLETVLEVPVPEEIFVSGKHKSWRSIKSWLTRPHIEKGSVSAGRDVEIQFLLGVIGAPLIPLPVRCDRTVNDHNIKGHPIESSMAKYIVQQYIAASGGEHALNSIDSMCAMGKVRMAASEFVAGDNLSLSNNTKLRTRKHGRPGELGGFVLWQKSPDMWNLELMVSGCKMSAGSNGKVAWRQTPWQHSHASRGPPRPLRRSLQGLDPKSTANLFCNSVCIGEKTVNDEDCFVLKLEANPSTLRARSSSNVEIIRHTICGCFSQRTGLLIQLEDSHLLRIKSPGGNVLWETTMESSIQDYRTINGVNIAHAGTTTVSLFRFGENSKTFDTRSRMEEEWSVEEVDFNIKGLSREFFLPPADLRKEDEECGVVANGGVVKSGGLRHKISGNSCRISSAKVVAIDEESLELFETYEEL
ncbi:uncharacterized protein LOC105160989 [Sesamum indicum]|uniref:Uncharacterized protein LOC105160989 n=1 Tax=Sesamum indicum TaxID=4182 RepID=A0A6I9T433_SESIN|nr:uncharacterized protein LOC105160989 [Sesamum indicum]